MLFLSTLFGSSTLPEPIAIAIADPNITTVGELYRRCKRERKAANEVRQSMV